MKYLRIILLSSIATLGLSAEAAPPPDDGMTIVSPTEKTIKQGRSAIWTLSDVATQYQPLHLTPTIQASLLALEESRFFDAVILLDNAIKKADENPETIVEMKLLFACLWLQGDQYPQALKLLATMYGDAQHAADAYALTTMVHLQQGQMDDALKVAQHARELGSGMLQHLVLSYALQGLGRLKDAHEVMHKFNENTPQPAIALAREAELALTLDQTQSAKALALRAQQMDATHPYIVSVSGLVWLIDGQIVKAREAFKTALKRDQKDTKALFGLGLAEIMLGEFEHGQGYLERAHKYDAQNALILTYLGRSQQRAGNTDDAMKNWNHAQTLDPKDPSPWLYQAQAELQDNRPLEALESLRKAQERVAYRHVYRGENLLKEDRQLLQSNLAEIQRRQGLEELAFRALTSSPNEKNAFNLRNQADVLIGQRFGESARRSLLLQSQFNDRPGNLPSELDIYGDGAGQTGATTPQHGVISSLNAQRITYNDYDVLFGRGSMLEVDTTIGGRNSFGEQIRVSAGNDALGLSIAQRNFKSDGFAPFEKLDNHLWQGIAQWRPFKSTQAFLSYQTFKSQRGETFYPAMPWGSNDAILDSSRVSRLGLRHNLGEDDELRALISRQQTEQANSFSFIAMPGNFSVSGGSIMHSEEFQYRRSGDNYAAQLGMHQSRGRQTYWGAAGISGDFIQNTKYFYADWQQTLNPSWQLDTGLGWGKIDNLDNFKKFGDNSTNLARWLPRMGAVYQPDNDTHLRLAAWRGMGFPSVGDATLASASLAGILLNRHGDNGQLLQAISLGADRQLTSSWLLSAKTQRRMTDLPGIDQNPRRQVLYRQRIDESRLALHWQVAPLMVSLAYEHERLKNDSKLSALNSVDQQSLRSQQLAFRWFAGAHWTANLKLSHNQVSGALQSVDQFFAPCLIPFQENFHQVDADMSFKFSTTGSLSAGVRNATDQRFKYTDIDMLNPRFSNGLMIYTTVRLAW